MHLAAANKKNAAGPNPGPRKEQLSGEQTAAIKEAFSLFAPDSGKLNPTDIRAAMQSLYFQDKHPEVLKLYSELPQTNKEMTVDELLAVLNNKLGNRETRDGINRIFDLFRDDPDSDEITVSSLRRMAREMGSQMSPEDLKTLLEVASSNGVSLTRAQFAEVWDSIQPPTAKRH